MENKEFKSGYIAIVGAPNAGKSTLLNQILGQKISITAPKPQTTRNRITGILTRPDCQMIFVDTPGILKARDEFNRGLVETALSSLSESDAVLFVIEPNEERSINDFILENLKRISTPVILLINKIDTLTNKGLILPVIHRWQNRHDFQAVIPISALQGDGTAQILAEVVKLLQPGPQFFPEDYVTDQPERFFVAELIREKIFHLVREEIPYAVAVLVEKFTELPEKNLIEIEAAINVERDSQKGIIIGKGGAMLKEIGKQARLEIETLLGCHIYLGLFVRVQKDWRKDPRALQEFGYPVNR
jgi:GTP-binding protein Era